MDSSESLTALRLAASIAILAYASLLDWRTRKVGNIYWIILSVIGLLLIPAQLAVDEQPMKYALVLVPVLAILSDVYLDSGNDTKALKFAPALKYTVAIVSVLVLGYWWAGEDYFQFLITVPLLMLFVVLMYMLDLIRGGADAKALLALCIMFPVYPAIGSLPFVHAETVSAETVFPFTFAVLVTAAIIVALFPVGFMIRNLLAREFKAPYGFLGYKLDVAGLKGVHVWLMENMEDGQRRLHTRPRRNEDLDKEVELLKAAGATRVWVTPKIPFIIPMTASLIFTATVGNLLFLLFQL